MRKLFFIVISVMVSISAIRMLLGNPPMSVSVFLHAVASLDLDFSTVLEGWISIAEDFSRIGSGNVFEAVFGAVKGLFNLLKLPIALVADLLYFLLSVVQFASYLLGFEIV